MRRVQKGARIEERERERERENSCRPWILHPHHFFLAFSCYTSAVCCCTLLLHCCCCTAANIVQDSGHTFQRAELCLSVCPLSFFVSSSCFLCPGSLSLSPLKGAVASGYKMLQLPVNVPKLLGDILFCCLLSETAVTAASDIAAN